MVSTLARHTGRTIAEQTPEAWQWRDRPVRLMDGATVALPDTADNQQVGLRIVKVRMGRLPLVRVVMSSSTRLDESHVDALKQLISERVGRAVLVEAQLNLRR